MLKFDKSCGLITVFTVKGQINKIQVGCIIKFQDFQSSIL